MSISMPIKISLVAAVAIIGGSCLFLKDMEAFFKQQDVDAAAQSRQEASDRAKAQREGWPIDLPAPSTPVTVVSPYGTFRIPLDNMGARAPFAIPASEPRTVSATGIGPYKWSSFSFSFWMPDGHGVITDATKLPINLYTDPQTLKSIKTPFRPREAGRTDPGPANFAVAFGEVCPLSGPAKEGLHPSDLGGTGYDYGAAPMKGCRDDEPLPDFRKDVREGSVEIGGVSDGWKIFCKMGSEICFGWVSYPQHDFRTLVYLPKDAMSHMNDITRMGAKLLGEWKVAD